MLVQVWQTERVMFLHVFHCDMYFKLNNDDVEDDDDYNAEDLS